MMFSAVLLLLHSGQEVIRGPRNSVPELRGQQGGRGRPDDDGRGGGRDGQQDRPSDLHMRPAGAWRRLRAEAPDDLRPADGDTEPVLRRRRQLQPV